MQDFTNGCITCQGLRLRCPSSRPLLELLIKYQLSCPLLPYLFFPACRGFFVFFFFATDSSKESFFKGKLRKMMGAEGTSQVVEAGGSRGLKYPHLLPPSACCLPTSVPWGPKPLAAGSWALVDEAS